MMLITLVLIILIFQIIIHYNYYKNMNINETRELKDEIFYNLIHKKIKYTNIKVIPYNSNIINNIDYSYDVEKRNVSNCIDKINNENIRNFPIKNIPFIDNPINYFERVQYLSHIIIKYCENYNNLEKSTKMLLSLDNMYEYKFTNDIIVKYSLYLFEHEIEKLEKRNNKNYKNIQILLKIISRYEDFYNYPLDILIMDDEIYILYNFYIMLKLPYDKLNKLNYHKYACKCMMNIKILRKFHKETLDIKEKISNWNIFVKLSEEGYLN